MKIKYGIALLFIVGIIISNVPSLYTMEAIEKPLRYQQEQEKKQIALGKKTLSIAAIAALLAIPVAYLSRLVYTYSKEYSFSVIAVAVRYGIPFQPHYLKTLAYAAQHDDQSLKNALISLNTKLLGDNWRQVRSSLVHDFIEMHQVAFAQKYGAELRRNIQNILKIYGASSDLLMRQSKIRTYTRGMPSLKNQAKYMDDLDKKLGL